MLSGVRSGLVSVVRASGQALDAVGRGFEVAPYIEHCKQILYLEQRIQIICFIAHNYIYCLCLVCGDFIYL